VPLTIVTRAHRSCPAILCDHCGQEIRRATDGNYHWRMDLDGPQPVAFTHKGCCTAFEAGEPDAVWAAQPLDALPAYLCRNLSVTVRQSEDVADWMGRL